MVVVNERRRRFWYNIFALGGMVVLGYFMSKVEALVKPLVGDIYFTKDNIYVKSPSGKLVPLFAGISDKQTFEGETSDSEELVFEVDLGQYYANYCIILIANTGSNPMDVILKKGMDDIFVPLEGFPITINAKDSYLIEVFSPVAYRLYVKNTNAGASTTYKIVRAVGRK